MGYRIFLASPKKLEDFTVLLDDALKAINSDYEAKRYNNITLAIPKVHQAKKACFTHG